MAGMVASAVGGLFVVRQFVSADEAAEVNDVAGFIYASLAVLYAVVAAFITVIIWERYSATEQLIESEASALAALFRHVEAFDPNVREEYRNAIRSYVEAILTDEWHTMRRGEPGQETQHRIERLWTLTHRLRVTTTESAAWLEIMVTTMNEAANLRRLRLSKSQGGVPVIMWALLLIGGAITVGYTYLFGLENVTAHAIMTGSLAAVLALILTVVVLMNHPFRGGLSVNPEPLARVLEYFEGQP